MTNPFAVLGELHTVGPWPPPKPRFRDSKEYAEARHRWVIPAHLKRKGQGSGYWARNQNIDYYITAGSRLALQMRFFNSIERRHNRYIRQLQDLIGDGRRTPTTKVVGTEQDIITTTYNVRGKYTMEFKSKRGDSNPDIRLKMSGAGEAWNELGSRVGVWDAASRSYKLPDHSINNVAAQALMLISKTKTSTKTQSRVYYTSNSTSPSTRKSKEIVVQDYDAPYYGVRKYYITSDGFLHGSQQQWDTDEMTASCRSDKAACVEHLTNGTCTCGIYAYKPDSEEMKRHNNLSITAQVVCWGRLVEHTAGVRAEKVRMLSVDINIMSTASVAAGSVYSSILEPGVFAKFKKNYPRVIINNMGEIQQQMRRLIEDFNITTDIAPLITVWPVRTHKYGHDR